MDSTSSSGAAAARQGTRIPRVLIVDDEPDLRELLELTLVRMGLDVDSAARPAFLTLPSFCTQSSNRSA